MPTNTLDLFVEERKQEVTLYSVVNAIDGESIDIEPIDLSSFSATEFKRIEILNNCNFRIECGTNSYARIKNVINHLRWRASAYTDGELHQDAELLTKFLTILQQSNIHYVQGSNDFVLFNDEHDDEQYVLLETHENWCGSDIRIACDKDDCIFMWISRNETGYSTSEDYIYYEDEYYADSDVASEHGIYYRDCCDEYHHEDTDYCCDNSNNSGETFDSAYTQMYNPEKFVDFTKTSNMKYTFGVELETCVSSSVPYTANINMKAVYDGSTDGLEYVSGVLHGNKGMDNVMSMCNFLNEHDAKVDRKCGVHVHIGGAEFNRRFSIMIARLCKEIESDVYSILPQSRAGNTYCQKLPDYVSELNFRNYRDKLGLLLMNHSIDRNHNKKKSHPGGHYNSQRYYWLNMTNYSCSTGPNTVEFRNHGGTLDYTKIYNWVLICMSIVKFAENQQRRIWNCGLSDKHKISLKDVLKYSLNNKDFENVWTYVKARAKQFGNKL